MTPAGGYLARGAALALLPFALLAPAGARAARPRVVELGGSTAPTAGASSLRVPNFLGEGTRTNGRIFGFDPNEGPYSCSGTALSTPSRSIVLTAGHCVLEEGSVGEDISFVPAYDHGKRPFGSFTAEAVYLMPQWRQHENPDFDVAALKVAPNRFGALTDVVGGRGYITGQSRFSAFQIYGYPAAALKGEELRNCRAHGLGSDAFTFRYFGPPTMPASCDMAGGSSGGAWVVAGQYVAGVTSYGYTTNPEKLYSPYFGRAIGSFLAQLP
jgi:V8-like Glu-specific endopeptidase